MSEEELFFKDIVIQQNIRYWSAELPLEIHEQPLDSDKASVVRCICHNWYLFSRRKGSGSYCQLTLLRGMDLVGKTSPNLTCCDFFLSR